jgi:hypothetical protein
MRVFILTDDDFEELFLSLDRDPRHRAQGGSSQVLSDIEQAAHDKAHRFLNYQVRTWAEKMKTPGRRFLG